MVHTEQNMGEIHEYNSGGGHQIINSRFEGPVHFDKVKWPSNPWTIPRGVNRLFTGREDIGSLLAQSFGVETEDVSVRVPRCFVISGPGGTGKSEVCIKYATEHRTRYWGLFWVDCKDSSTALESFRRIGKLCGDDHASIASVKDMLSTHDERWLLVIDNADDIRVKYSSYFPSGGNGDIIVTTRNPELRELYATVRSTALGQLKTSLARELLLRSTGIPQSEWANKREITTEIVEELGNHTLALLHAGAYIKHHCRIERYLELYRRRRETLFTSERSQEEATYETVHATFEVCFSKLEDLRSNGNAEQQVTAGDAIELVTLLAFMHYEGEIEEVFREASEYAMEIKSQDSDEAEQSPDILTLSRLHTYNLPGYLPEGADDGLPSRWKNACRMLSALSLVEFRSEDDPSIMSMHSLTHQWLKERLSYVHPFQEGFKAQCRAWYEASRLIALSCRGAKLYYSMYEVVGTHVHACLNHPISLYSEQLQSKSVLAILWQLAWAQFSTYDEHNAEQVLSIIRVGLLRDADLSDRERELMETHVRRLTGMWLANSGDSGRAVVELEKAVEAYARHLNQEDHTRLACQHELAGAYHENGQIEEAIKLLEHVVNVRKETLDETDYDRLASQHQLAGAYEENGQVEKAIELLEYVIDVYKRIVDETDTSRLASEHELAIAYESSGRTQEAIKILEHVVSVNAKKLDKTNPDLLTCQQTLAGAYLSNSQTETAIELSESVVKVCRETLDEAHPCRLTAQHGLARAYLANRQPEAALSLLEANVQVQEKKLHDTHPDLLRSYSTLAALRLEHQEFGEAIRLFKRVIEFQARTLPKGHPDQLKTLRALARTYRLMGLHDRERQVQAVVQKLEAKNNA